MTNNGKVGRCVQSLQVPPRLRRATFSNLNPKKTMLHPTIPGRHLTTKEIRHYRQHLYEKQQGLCYWCTNPMLFMETIPERHLQTHANIATFEHLHDRLCKGGKKYSEGTIVIACSACNNERNKRREAIIVKTLKQLLRSAYSKRIQGKSPPQLLEELGLNPLESLEE
jgi:hypothetical protein